VYIKTQSNERKGVRMKKVMVLALMFGLIMPVNAWTLFPKLRDSKKSTDEQMVELYKRHIEFMEHENIMMVCVAIGIKIFHDIVSPIVYDKIIKRFHLTPAAVIGGVLF
jgi:hypothetical protein